MNFLTVTEDLLDKTEEHLANYVDIRAEVQEHDLRNANWPRGLRNRAAGLAT